MDKIYFNRGDLVQLKKDVTNKPARMMVQTVDKVKYKNAESGQLLGITCFWFTENGFIQRSRFDSKDLKHVE